MVDQIGSKRDWSSLIEEDSHLRGRANPILDFGEALLGMLKHGRNLLGRDTGKPFQELISRRAGFQVLEEGAHGHASSAKDPGAAYFVLGALNLLAIGPIQHADHDMLPFFSGQVRRNP